MKKLVAVLMLGVLMLMMIEPASATPDQSIAVLTPQSCPKLGENWAIYFETAGPSALVTNYHSFPEEVDVQEELWPRGR
ncbi:MAG: hypothetical protein QMC77_06135 [Methanocellales archaeon]|nr:hypothetical protein [Methanocellales archaeon]